MTPEDPPFYGCPPGSRAPDQTFWLEARDGPRLRAGVWSAEAPVGYAIYLAGRTEYLEKQALPITALAQMGLSVLALDWRGQGLSDRLTFPTAKGHVGSFDEYQTDLDALLNWAEAAGFDGPCVLVGHSMGGLIAATALSRAEIAETVDVAVLSAPLFGLAMGPVSRTLIWAMVQVAAMTGLLERWPPVGNVDRTYALTDPAENVLTSDDAVWNWMREMALSHPQLTLAMPSLGWFRALDQEIARAARLSDLPGPCLCLLGSSENVVSARKVRDWCHQTGAGLFEIAGARHEVLVERPDLRHAAWSQVGAFLRENGVPVVSVP